MIRYIRPSGLVGDLAYPLFISAEITSSILVKSRIFILDSVAESVRT